MELTNEEKKAIGDAAAQMMQAFCEFRLAEERMNVANSLSRNLAHIELQDELINNSLVPFVKAFQESQKMFFDSLGIPQSNKEFWDWYNKQQECIGHINDKSEAEGGSCGIK